MFNAKSQAYKAKVLCNSAKIASGETSALDNIKTQAYKAKVPLGSAKRASSEAKIVSCEVRTTAAPNGLKDLCEAKLDSGKASVTLSKVKATAFSKTKKQTFVKGVKPKASLQTPQ